MSQVDAVRRRLTDPKAIELLWLVPRWAAFNRETIADALVICGGDPVVADKLCERWRQDRALSEEDHRLPESALLDYLRQHAPAALQDCPCNTCRLDTKQGRLEAMAKLGAIS